MRLRGVHVMHEGRGDSWTLYLGRHRGARYIGVDVRGHNGWASYPAWLPGGWAYFNPTLSTGRLFMSESRSWSFGVKLPSKAVDFYRWRVRPSGRRFMREHGHDEPQRAL